MKLRVSFNAYSDGWQNSSDRTEIIFLLGVDQGALSPPRCCPKFFAMWLPEEVPSMDVCSLPGQQKNVCLPSEGFSPFEALTWLSLAQLYHLPLDELKDS